MCKKVEITFDLSDKNMEYTESDDFKRVFLNMACM
jgi:hypothetical protein